MPPASKYRHVTRRRFATEQAKPWQAMVCHEYLGTFANEEEAAQAAADKLGQPKKTLLRSHQAKPSKRSHPKRSHRFVYWHRAESKWQVKIGTQHYGNFAEHDEALAMATKKTGLTIEDLQLHPDCVRKSVQGQRHAVSQHLSWFQHLYQAFADPKEVAYPGDVADMHRRASQGSLILAHPNFIIPMMLAKFGPHRDALADAFLKVPKPDNDPSELQWTYLVIVAALVTLSRIDISIMDEWLSGPGRQTTHHSGLVVYSHVSLKILTPCHGELPPKKRKRGPNSPQVLVLGRTARAFRIQPYTPELGETLAKVRTFGLALLTVQPPNSLAEWIQAMSEMTTAVPKAPGIPSAKCYRYKWVVRGFWDFTRRQAGAAPGITWLGHHTVRMEIPELVMMSSNSNNGNGGCSSVGNWHHRS